MGIQEQVNQAFQNSDVAGSDRVGNDRDGLQSGDVSGSLGAQETSILRAQETQAAASGTLAELAKERVGDPTATVQDGVATATSPDTLGSDVVNIGPQDVADAAQDVQASEGGEFAVGTTGTDPSANQSPTTANAGDGNQSSDMAPSDVVPGWVPADAPDVDLDLGGIGARSLAIGAAVVVGVGAAVAGWFS